jgi:hypothetical protein
LFVASLDLSDHRAPRVHEQENPRTTKPEREEMAKGQDFETFIGQWAKEHIRPIDTCADLDDLLYAATQRSDQLTLLAAQTGFYQPLRQMALPYGGVVEYILSLFDDAKRMIQ